MTQFVAADVIAHRFEFTAFAASDGSSLDGQEGASTERLKFHLAGTPHIRVDLDSLRLPEIGLAPDKTEP